jgi:hypothetical protein
MNRTKRNSKKVNGASRYSLYSKTWASNMWNFKAIELNLKRQF